MQKSIAQHAMGHPVRSARGLLLSQSQDPDYPLSITSTKLKRFERPSSFAARIKDHVSLGMKLTETMKGKLSLGAKVLQIGGLGKVFRKNFSVREGEKLLQACQCYLSTTAGPIAGLLFISTDKVAFSSERSIKTISQKGELLKFQYKVSIPLGKIKGVGESKDMKRPSTKYMDILTLDDFDFWFMGFLNYNKTLRYLHKAISHKSC